MSAQRCATCAHPLTHWGGRLLCANAHCPGSPLEPDEPGQLELPGIGHKEAT